MRREPHLERADGLEDLALLQRQADRASHQAASLAATLRRAAATPLVTVSEVRTAGLAFLLAAASAFLLLP